MSTTFKFKTREEWLLSAIEEMRSRFESNGYKIPEIRVACGWPSHGGVSRTKRTIGQCWSTEAAADKIGQIFISPYLDGKPNDEQGVLPTLVHEVAHAIVGVKEKHNKVFGKCARAVGLEGKLTSTIAGKALLDDCKAWDERLGPYPHAQLDLLHSPVKKQTTRAVKCTCPECGYVCRTTRKWLEEAGAPICPKHKAMSYEIPDELEKDGGEDE